MEDIQNNSFIDGRIRISRLVSERTTLSKIPKKQGQNKLALKAATNSVFQVGVKDSETPAKFKVEINYKVVLSTHDNDDLILEYELEYSCEFILVRWAGFSDWQQLPEEAIGPYLSFAHHIAKCRAEETIVKMGLRGVKLPSYDDTTSANGN